MEKVNYINEDKMGYCQNSNNFYLNNNGYNEINKIIVEKLKKY